MLTNCYSMYQQSYCMLLLNMCVGQKLSLDVNGQTRQTTTSATRLEGTSVKFLKIRAF